jgi:hypothetical protein
MDHRHLSNITKFLKQMLNKTSVGWLLCLKGEEHPCWVSTRKNQIETGVLEPIPKLELESIYLKNWTQNQILSSIYVWNENWNPEF